MDKITEQSSNYTDLENMSTKELVTAINAEDKKVAMAIEQCLPQIEELIDAIYDKMSNGGKLYYIGAGTSGRLGVLDASECPPTFGVAPTLVQGIIAGGDKALRTSIENAEDDTQQAVTDLINRDLQPNDAVIGIAASGTTPYVVEGIKRLRALGYLTGSISCNPRNPLSIAAEYPIEAIVGPEFITGSTRLKSGTAQKMILNMISTTLMIKLGRVKGNKMVDMMLSNDKLVDRGTKQVQELYNISYEEAQKVLLDHGSVRRALQHLKDNLNNI